MQINRLFEIVYLLMRNNNVTAKELAERFEVSTRTVYRDIDTLSEAGIPVYSSRGTGGGIRLLDGFVLNKSLLSENEQNEILASLQSLQAIKAPDTDSALIKLAGLFGRNQQSWIDVDFSNWGGGLQEREKLMLLKDSVLHSRVITFDYYSSGCEKTERTAEPLKLLFKGQGWYLYAFCRIRQEPRIFKINRMKNLKLTKETFQRAVPDNLFDQAEQFFQPPAKVLTVRLKLDASAAYRVFDELEDENTVQNPDGSFLMTVSFPPGEWIYGFLLSFGSAAEVLEPESLRQEIKQRLKDMLKKYE